MEDIAVLKQARAIVAAGWVQNSWEFRDPITRASFHCLGSAIYNASGMRVSEQECPAMRAFNKAAFGIDTHLPKYIVSFNDMPGRTKTEVLALLDGVIVNLEAGVFVKRLHYVASEPSQFVTYSVAPLAMSKPFSVSVEYVDTPLGIVKCLPKKLHVERELSVVDLS